ncbi:MAG: hypothetical protein AAGC67_15450 [Myxococcota bacterium]
MPKVGTRAGLRVLWLLVAWPAPAVIAGLAGWNGIWGSGSASIDYLIPIPVAGGVLHVPSFLLATAVVFAHGREATPATGRGGWLGPVLLGVSLCGLAGLVDLERIFRALTTDVPFRLRVERNALALFVTTDALLAFLWTQGARFRITPRWALALALPLLLVGLVFAHEGKRTPPLRPGIVLHGEARGDQMRWIYAKPQPLREFEDAALRHALAHAPENDAIAEDTAFFFTSSATAAERGTPDGIFATICLYEDGSGPILGEGRLDCFAHASFSERLAAGRIDLDAVCEALAASKSAPGDGRAEARACRRRAARR